MHCFAVATTQIWSSEVPTSSSQPQEKQRERQRLRQNLQSQNMGKTVSFCVKLLTLPFLLLLVLHFSECILHSEAATAEVQRPLRGAKMAPGFAYARAPIPRSNRTAALKSSVANPKRKCSARYWSAEGKESWPVAMVPLQSSVAKVFGSQAAETFGESMTLAEALQFNLGNGSNNGDEYKKKLLKQASAALINAYSRQGFKYRAWTVKTLFIGALSSRRAALAQADLFRDANRACSGLR